MDAIGVATMSLSVVVGGIARGSRGKAGKGNEESEAHHLFSENIFPPAYRKVSRMFGTHTCYL